MHILTYTFKYIQCHTYERILTMLVYARIVLRANGHGRQEQGAICQKTCRYMQTRPNTYCTYEILTCQYVILILYICVLVSCTYVHVFFSSYVQIHQFVFAKNTCRIRTNRITDGMNSKKNACVILPGRSFIFGQQPSAGLNNLASEFADSMI